MISTFIKRVVIILALTALTVFAATPAAHSAGSAKKSQPKVNASSEAQLRVLVGDYLKMMSTARELDRKLLGRMIEYTDGKGATAEDLNHILSRIKNMQGKKWANAVVSSIEIEDEIAKVFIEIGEEKIRNNACLSKGQWYLQCASEHVSKKSE